MPKPCRKSSRGSFTENRCYKCVVLEIENDEAGSGEAKDQITDYESGFAIRYVEGSRYFMQWQAGLMTTEFRSYRDNGMTTPFTGTVSLFYLRGYGASKDDAIAMALKAGRNGR